MNPQLSQAVTERIQSGHAREEILAELHAAGYESGEAAEIYEAAQSSLTLADQSQDTPSVVAVATAAEPPVATEVVAGEKRWGSEGADPAPEAAPFLDTPPSVSTEIEAGPETPPTPPTPPAPPTPPNSVSSAEKPFQDSPSSNSHTGLIIAGVGLVVFLLLGAALAYTIDMRQVWSLLPFTSSAPYNEVTLLSGVIERVTTQERTQATSDFALLIEAPDPSVPAGPDDLFEVLQFMLALSGLAFPEEAHMKMSSVLRADARNEEDIRFDQQIEVDVLFEPVTFRAGGSLRFIQDTLYGRIDRLPPMLAAQLETEGVTLPSGQWIELFNVEDFEDLFTPGFHQQLTPRPLSPGEMGSPSGGSGAMPEMFYQAPTQVFAAFTGDRLWSSLTTFSKLVREETVVPNIPLTANLGQLITDNLPDELADDERAQVEEGLTILAQAWRRHPLIAFAQNPYQITDQGERVYVYEIVPAVNNIEPFLRRVVSEFEASSIPADFMDMTEIKAFLADTSGLEEMKEALVALEEYYNLRFHIRTDGSVQALLLDAAVRSELEAFPHQFRLQMHVRYSADQSFESIDVPTDLYEKTLLEILENSAQEVVDIEIPEIYVDVPDFTEGLPTRADELLFAAESLRGEIGSYNICEDMRSTLREVVSDFTTGSIGSSASVLGEFSSMSAAHTHTGLAVQCLSGASGYVFIMTAPGESNLYCINNQKIDLYGREDDDDFLDLCRSLGGPGIVF